MKEPSSPGTKGFCVGQAKSGTASLAGLLANYRVAHEPERGKTLEMVVKDSHGDISAEAFRQYLIKRSERLNLEYDIAWANQFMIKHLVSNFPDTRFIVLIRNPFTWLQSIAGHLTSREIPPEVRSFLDWWFRPDLYPHTNHDASLKELRLYSVNSFLNAWNWHVTTCLQLIPPKRRLILKTSNLNQSHSELADFLKISVKSLKVDQGHRNRSTSSIRLESLVSNTYLNERIESICGEHMANLFPEITGTGSIF